MKTLFTAVLIIINVTVWGQIHPYREIKMENPISSMVNHLYSFYTACPNMGVYQWKTKIADSRNCNVIAINPTGRYLANSINHKVEIWKLNDDTARLINTISNHKKKVMSMAFSSQGQFASAGLDREIHITDIKEPENYYSLVGHRATINSICYNAQGTRLYSCSDDSTVIVWFSANKKIEKVLPFKEPLTCVSVSTNNLLLVGTASGNIIIYDLDKNVIRNEFKGKHTGRINCLSVSDNNLFFASASDDKKVKIWSFHISSEYTQLYEFGSPAIESYFIKDYNTNREFLITAEIAKTIKVWEVTDLPIPVSLKIKEEVKHEIEQWEQKRQDESNAEYANRMSFDVKSKQVTEIQNSIINKYAIQKHSLDEPVLSDYNQSDETFVISYSALLQFDMKIPANQANEFKAHIDAMKLKKYQFELNNDEFQLSYVEYFDSISNKTYFYDKNGNKNNESYRIVKEEEPPIEALVEVANKQDTLKQNLETYIQQKKEEKVISENVSTNVKTKVTVGQDSVGNAELNYNIEYSYEVIKASVGNITDDFPLGKYKLTTSNAAKITIQMLKETVEKELVKYIKPGMNVTVKITGSTDATPIANIIQYSGEYGDFEDEPYFNNNNLESMVLNQHDGIRSNEQLAFLRTYGVRKFITDYIEPFKNTKLTFQHYTVVSKEKGSQFRRISIEVILHGAFNEFKNKQVNKNRNEIDKPIAVNISDVDQNIPITADVNDKTFAVIIANENYVNEVPVGFALNDGKIFKDYCEKTLGLPSANIHYAPDASFGKIKTEINWINSVAKAYNGEAKFIFYYAGHGMPNEMTKSAYILPVDAVSSDFETSIKLEDLYAKLNESPAKNITVLLDACFSGSQRNEGMLVQARSVKLVAKTEQTMGNAIVFSAATGDETAYPFKDKQHGLFTYFLLKKLQETKGDVTYGELFDYIKTNVSQQSIVVNQKSQTPMANPSVALEGSWREMKIK